jgi:hypothetical protein
VRDWIASLVLGQALDLAREETLSVRLCAGAWPKMMASARWLLNGPVVIESFSLVIK